MTILNSQSRTVAASFLVGAVFAVGLALSGMTLPQKVIGFLDFTGDWDPSLAFVMGGAVLVYGVVFRYVLKMQQPVFAAKFSIPMRRDINWRLIAGAGIFGVGWGLGGFCPGPALASGAAGASGMLDVFAFVISMVAGMFLYKGFDTMLARAKQPAPEQEEEPQTSDALQPEVASA